MKDCELAQDDLGRWWCPLCDPEKRHLLPANVPRNCGMLFGGDVRAVRVPSGPGDHLHAMIQRKYGQKAIEGCGCDGWIAKMNRWGVAGCQERADLIAAHLVKQASKAGYKRASLPGAHAYCKHRLVLVAVRMAEEAAAATSP